MVTNESDRRTRDPEGPLEKALIDEFLLARHLDVAALHLLPDVEAGRVWMAASVYAALKLAEIEARAHFVHAIHGEE
jgi:hypothetical protein